MKLVQVDVVDGEKVGMFTLKNGKRSTIPQSQLKDEDAERMEYWTPMPPGAPSVFDDYLWGNVVTVGQDFKFNTAKRARKPEKYYVFYYTSSWCGPCLEYTPKLMEWYAENKNDNFEIFLISSDLNSGRMAGYARKMKMIWPHLAFYQIKDFKEKFREEHGAHRIPRLVVCTPDGKVLGNYRGKLKELSAMVK